MTRIIVRRVDSPEVIADFDAPLNEISVPMLKQRVFELTHVPSDRQRLLFRGRELVASSETQPLSELQLEDGCVVHMVLRQPGVPAATRSTPEPSTVPPGQGTQQVRMEFTTFHGIPQPATVADGTTSFSTFWTDMINRMAQLEQELGIQVPDQDRNVTPEQPDSFLAAAIRRLVAIETVWNTRTLMPFSVQVEQFGQLTDLDQRRHQVRRARQIAQQGVNIQRLFNHLSALIRQWHAHIDPQPHATSFAPQQPATAGVFGPVFFGGTTSRGTSPTRMPSAQPQQPVHPSPGPATQPSPSTGTAQPTVNTAGTTAGGGLNIPSLIGSLVQGVVSVMNQANGPTTAQTVPLSTTPRAPPIPISQQRATAFTSAFQQHNSASTSMNVDVSAFEDPFGTSSLGNLGMMALASIRDWPSLGSEFIPATMPWTRQVFANVSRDSIVQIIQGDSTGLIEVVAGMEQMWRANSMRSSTSHSFENVVREWIPDVPTMPSGQSSLTQLQKELTKYAQELLLTTLLHLLNQIESSPSTLGHRSRVARNFLFLLKDAWWDFQHRLTQLSGEQGQEGQQEAVDLIKMWLKPWERPVEEMVRRAARWVMGDCAEWAVEGPRVLKRRRRSSFADADAAAAAVGDDTENTGTSSRSSQTQQPTRPSLRGMLERASVETSIPIAIPTALPNELVSAFMSVIEERIITPGSTLQQRSESGEDDVD